MKPRQNGDMSELLNNYPVFVSESSWGNL